MCIRDRDDHGGSTTGGSPQRGGNKVDGGLAPAGALDDEDAGAIDDQGAYRLKLAIPEVNVPAPHKPSEHLKGGAGAVGRVPVSYTNQPPPASAVTSDWYWLPLIDSLTRNSPPSAEPSAA